MVSAYFTESRKTNYCKPTCLIVNWWTLRNVKRLTILKELFVANSQVASTWQTNFNLTQESLWEQAYDFSMKNRLILFIRKNFKYF